MIENTFNYIKPYIELFFWFLIYKLMIIAIRDVLEDVDK